MVLKYISYYFGGPDYVYSSMRSAEPRTLSNTEENTESAIHATHHSPTRLTLTSTNTQQRQHAEHGTEQGFPGGSGGDRGQGGKMRKSKPSFKLSYMLWKTNSSAQAESKM